MGRRNVCNCFQFLNLMYNGWLTALLVADGKGPGGPCGPEDHGQQLRSGLLVTVTTGKDDLKALLPCCCTPLVSLGWRLIEALISVVLSPKLVCPIQNQGGRVIGKNHRNRGYHDFYAAFCTSGQALIGMTRLFCSGAYLRDAAASLVAGGVHPSLYQGAATHSIQQQTVVNNPLCRPVAVLSGNGGGSNSAISASQMDPQPMMKRPRVETLSVQPMGAGGSATGQGSTTGLNPVAAAAILSSSLPLPPPPQSGSNPSAVSALTPLRINTNVKVI